MSVCKKNKNQLQLSLTVNYYYCFILTNTLKLKGIWNVKLFLVHHVFTLVPSTSTILTCTWLPVQVSCRHLQSGRPKRSGLLSYDTIWTAGHRHLYSLQAIINDPRHTQAVNAESLQQPSIISYPTSSHTGNSPMCTCHFLEVNQTQGTGRKRSITVCQGSEYLCFLLYKHGPKIVIPTPLLWPWKERQKGLGAEEKLVCSEWRKRGTGNIYSQTTPPDATLISHRHLF